MFSRKCKIEELNKKYNYIVQNALDKNSFKYLGVESYKTKLLIIQKKSEHTDETKFKNNILEIKLRFLI